MGRYVNYFITLLFGLLIPFHLIGQMSGSFSNFPESSSCVKIELIQEENSIKADRPFWVALRLNLEEGWHVYWKNPGDAGIPLKVEWELPSGFEAGPLQWPFPEKFTVADMVGYGYEKEVILLAQITPPAKLEPTEKINIRAHLNWLVCSSMTCQPGEASADLPLVISSAPQTRTESNLLFTQTRAKIPQSHIEVKTVRKDGVVQIEVKSDENHKVQKDSIQTVYFFPEEKDVIDASKEPTMSKQDLNRYLVNLKGSDEIGAQSKILKGVLVIHQQNGAEESYNAFDIDSPIEDEAGILGFVDDLHAGHSPSIKREKNDEAQASSSFQFEGGMGLALFFAFIGGMILNLMPCVLPVLSFKVMGFIKMAGQSRSLTLKHGLIFSLGVIFSFWVLASLMFVLRAYGNAVGWGFQLQEPLFVVILASFLFIFALNLFGVFELGMVLSSWAGQTQADNKKNESSFTGSFLSGILATAVATPCTGPFLGSTVGFAVTLPIYQSLLIFTFLALGMCFPYLLLAGFPSLLRFMPKPGPWMETFKQLMGFVLLATVLWLLWVFSAQTGTFSLICLLAGFLFFSFGAWIYGRGSSPLVSRKKQIMAYVSVLLLGVLGWQAIVFPRAGWHAEVDGSAAKTTPWAGWEEFSPERVAQLRKEGRPILIDFTAKWCLVCQVNHFVLASNEVEQKLAEAGVVKMMADWTKNDPVITNELSKFGRNSVPLYLLYGDDKDKEPLILPQVLTADIVIDHLNDSISTGEIALR